MKYPIGIQTFEDIRNGNYAYVDKTRYIYQLVSTGKYYFLSRPRRFGKSLTVSTLRSYFEGRSDLFEGLAIASLETEWKRYPVLDIDFNTIERGNPDSLNDRMEAILKRFERQYGITEIASSYPVRLENVIHAAYERTGMQVVVLVDEYDKPMLANMEMDEPLEATRNRLKAFYSVLKSEDRYIRFGFLTGVTRFSKVSVFSDLNNLNDISMDRQYAGLCGITGDELHTFFDEGVDELAAENGMDKQQCYDELKHQYDGYHFAHDTVGVYNPFSVLNALSKRQFDSYWFATGTPTFLARALQRADCDIADKISEPITVAELSSVDSITRNPIPIIFQSGYLTVKEYDPRFKQYILGYPNEEVRQGFISYLLPYYADLGDLPLRFASRFVRDVERGNPEGFMQRMKEVFDRRSYVLSDGKTRERDFQNAIYLMFELMGFYVEAEQTTARGRIDITVQTRDYVYLIELKQDHSAEEALEQIERMGYARRFSGDSRTLFRIGVGFSSAERRITGYIIN